MAQVPQITLKMLKGPKNKEFSIFLNLNFSKNNIKELLPGSFFCVPFFVRTGLFCTNSEIRTGLAYFVRNKARNGLFYTIFNYWNYKISRPTGVKFDLWKVLSDFGILEFFFNMVKVLNKFKKSHWCKHRVAS